MRGVWGREATSKRESEKELKCIESTRAVVWSPGVLRGVTARRVRRVSRLQRSLVVSSIVAATTTATTGHLRCRTDRVRHAVYADSGKAGLISIAGIVSRPKEEAEAHVQS